MDHLPVPIGRKEHVVVGFYARRTVYRPGDFFNLPQEHIGRGIDALLLHGLPPYIDPRSANEFVQSWLFFALLSQVLQEDIDTSSFIDPEPRALHTRSLRRILRRWTQRETACLSCSAVPVNNNRMISSRWSQASRALVIAKDFLSSHNYVQNKPDQAFMVSDFANALPVHSIRPTIIDESLLLSVAVLGEALEQTIDHVHSASRLAGGIREPLLSHSSVHWGRNKFIEDTLRNQGWCPNRLSTLVGSMRLSALYYIHSVTETNTFHRLHEHCTPFRCDSQVPGFDPVHRDCQGSCERYYPVAQNGELDQWVEAGMVPLVRWDKKSGPVIEPHDLRSKKLVFGAVSHSWAEGIIPCGLDARGSNDRRMHVCQIRSLQRTFNKLADATNGDNHGSKSDSEKDIFDIPFWVDVLCMPRSLRAKSVALNQLKDIYSLAKHVLVWDRSLLEEESTTDLRQIGARIRLGHWSTRLWTLQEAVMASPRALYFETKDGALIGLADLIAISRKARDDLTDEHHYCWEAISAFDPSVLKQRQMFHGNASSSRGEALRNLWHIMRSRLVDRPEDECIIVANILGIDVAQLRIPNFDEDPVEWRMKALLKAIDSIPNLVILSDIIFLPQGKRRLPGYEWAPRTWLNTSDRPDTLPLILDQSARTASLGPHGLTIRYSGFHIQFTHRFVDGKSTIRIPKRFWVHDSTISGRWHEIRLDHEEHESLDFDARVRASDTAHMYLIFSSRELHSWKAALLVRQIADQRDGKPLLVERLCRALAREETDVARPYSLNSDLMSLEGADRCLGRAVPDDQEWCLSGGGRELKQASLRDSKYVGM